MPLAVEFINVVLWLHITAAILAFGPTFGYAFFQTVAERTDPRAVPTVMRAMSMIDRYLVTPGAIVVIVAGLYLTIDDPSWDFSDVFVGFGIVASIVLLGLVHGFFLPAERRLSELATRDVEAAGGGEPQLSDEYLALSKKTGQIGTLAGLLVIITVYFMAAKPFL